MTFDINQNTFPSTTHKSIWHTAVYMAPFNEVIPANLPAEQSLDLIEGEKSFYQFILDLYSDMYNNPEAYYIPILEYDSFMNSKVGKDFTDKDKKQESKLRNKFQKAIQFYQKLLFEIGSKAQPELGSYNLLIDKSILYDALSKHNLNIVLKDSEKRISALSNLGMVIDISGNKITISNIRYTKMLIALSALCKADNKKYLLTNFLRCDFRGLNNSYKPEFNDIISILPNKFKKTVLDMNDYMQAIKCTYSAEPLKNTTLQSDFKLLYKLNGKLIYSFNADTDSLKTFAYFNHHDNISRMGYLLKDESESLFAWFYDRIPTSICSCKNNKLVDIGGRTKRICGLMNRIDVTNPSDENMKNLKNVLQLYLQKVNK